MVPLLLKELAEEKVVLLEQPKISRLPFPLQGVTRLIDKKGQTVAMVLDKAVWEDLTEYMEYSTPEFWEEIEASRKSGRVSSKAIKKRLGIK